MRLNGDDSEHAQAVEHGAELLVEATIASREGRVPVVHVGIVRADGTPVYGVSSDMDGVQPRRRRKGTTASCCACRNCRCCRAATRCAFTRWTRKAYACSTPVERGLSVKGRSRELGLVRLPHVWEHAAPLQAAPPS